MTKLFSYFQQFVNKFTKTKYYLILANFLLVFFLILFFNLKVFPMRTGDFIFLVLVYAIFALYRPGWSFLFFVGTIALENINLAPENLGIAIRPFQLAGGLTVFSLLLRYFLKRLNFQLVKLKWFDYLVGFFLFSGFLSSFSALDKSMAFKQSIILVSFGALYWLVRNYVQSPGDLKKIVPFFSGSSIVVIFYSILQNIRFKLGLNPFETMPGRPNGTFAEPDWLGIYLVMVLAMVYLAIYYFRNRKEQMFFYAYLIFVYAALIISVSRSAWLGGGFITLVFLKSILTNFSFRIRDWQWPDFLRKSIFVFGSLAISVIIVYVFHLTSFQLFNRMSSTASGLQLVTVSCVDDFEIPKKIENVQELKKYNCRHINLEEISKEKTDGKIIKEVFRDDPNVKIRSEIYQKSLAQIKAHPVLGIGWGNIANVLGKDERGSGLNSSNILLETYLGSGILGLVALISLLAFILIRSVWLCLKENSEIKIIGLFGLLGLFGILIPNLFNAGIFLGIFWVWLGAVSSILLNYAVRKN